MGHTFECSKCERLKTEAAPLDGSTLLCMACQHKLLPPPPPMRTPHHPRTPGLAPMLVVLVFVAGVAVGTKMAGGW